LTPDVPLVLVWPDAGQTDSALRGLPADVADDAIVAAWDPSDDDGGRAALLASVRDARDSIAARGGNPDQLTLVGFGLGAVAAAGLARYARRLGIGLGRVIAVAGAWDEPDPFSGGPIEDIPERVELVPEGYLLGITLRRT
jgi:surfactin synthase thioesterase subunit